MSAPSNIKVLVLDVDGVLTNGLIGFTGILDCETKFFHVHDGLGISLWQKAGFHTVLISGRNAQCVATRANELKITHIKQGSKDKVADLDAFLRKLGCTSSETCFVGDDLGDIPAMQHVGYTIAVQNAVQEVKELANWTTTKNGGDGAVREAIEHLMKANNTWEHYVSSLMTEHATQ